MERRTHLLSDRNGGKRKAGNGSGALACTEALDMSRRERERMSELRNNFNTAIMLKILARITAEVKVAVVVVVVVAVHWL